MFPPLSAAQRQAIEKHGTPLAVLDETTGQPYVLMKVKLAPAQFDGVRAMVPGVSAAGEGDDPDDALVALCSALRAYLDAFGNA